MASNDIATFKLNLTGEEIQKILQVLSSNVPEGYIVVSDGKRSIKFKSGYTGGDGILIDPNTNEIKISEDVENKLNRVIEANVETSSKPSDPLTSLQIDDNIYTLDSIDLTVSSVDDPNAPSIRTIQFGDDKFKFLPSGIEVNSEDTATSNITKLKINDINYAIPSAQLILSDDMPSEEAKVVRLLTVGGDTFKFEAIAAIDDKSIDQEKLSQDIQNKLNSISDIESRLGEIENTVNNILE